MADDSARQDPKDNDGASRFSLIDGPLGVLYGNEFVSQNLQFPLDLESGQENHWIRFDMMKQTGINLGERDVSSSVASGGGIFREGKLLEGISGAASAVVTTALLSPINAAKSVVGEFVNSLPPGLAGIGKAFIGGATERTQNMGSVMLYAPYSRQETMTLDWATESTGKAGSLLKQGKVAIGDSVGDTARNLVDAIKAQGIPALKSFGAAAAGSALRNEGAGKLIEREFNLVQNPHLEAFFSGIQFRRYNWTFKLAPRNRSEAIAIQKIVQLLKHAAAPSYQNGRAGFFLHYPYVFDITTFDENQTHRIGRSCLKEITVNHSASAGVNHTFYDNYPLETDIGLSFIELDILDKSKVEKGF